MQPNPPNPMASTEVSSHDVLAERIAQRGGPEVIWGKIRQGHTIRRIAKEYGVTTGALYYWRDKLGLKDDWEAAMQDAADDHVDKAHDLAARETSVDSAGVVRSRLERADFFLKLAKVRNRDKYSDRQAQGPTLNIGSLHLAALQEAGFVSNDQALNPPTQDAEVIQEPSPLPTQAEDTEEPDADWDEAIDELM